MPCLYRRHADEIHVYYTRMPKKNGAAGWLDPVILAFCLLFLLCFLVFAFILNHILLDEPSPELDKGAAGLALFVVLGGWGFSRYWRKLIFSTSTGMVSRSLFWKKKLGRFEDFSGVVLDGFDSTLWFALAWKDGRRKPLSLSQSVRDSRRLAVYHREIVPLLTEIMGLPEFRGETTEFRPGWLPTVEKTFEPLIPPESIGIGDPRGENEYRNFIHDERTGLYKERITAAAVVFVELLLGGMAAVGWAGFHFEIWVLLVVWTAAVVFLLWMLVKGSIAYRLDPRNKAVISYTHFGCKKQRLPLESLVKVKHVHLACFHSAGLFFNQDGLKMLDLTTGFSDGAIRDCLREFGQIMGTDVEKFLE